MKHLTAMAIKFVSTLVLLYVILGLFFGMSFINVFLITLVLGVISYLLGDMLILPKTNNTIATIADFGLAFPLIWLMTLNMTYGVRTFGISLIAAIGLTLFEVFFHQYLKRNIVDSNDDVKINRRSLPQLQYSAENAEEFTPVKPDVRSQEEDNTKE
ncbi:YndM family protein [Mesobacillus maritimus]|uniref:YndM family protein n=1 Tax=Mesobacillus maritimus TaxID=1643336 RepID=UPI00384C2D3C